MRLSRHSLYKNILNSFCIQIHRSNSINIENMYDLVLHWERLQLMHIFHYATFVRATRLVPFAYDSIENEKNPTKKIYIF